MSPAEPVPCQHCRRPVPPDRTLPFCGKLLCEPCFDDAVRTLRVAEALSAQGFRLRKPRAA